MENDGVSGVTTSAIVYDELTIESPEIADQSFRPRLIYNLSELFLASSLLILTTQTLSIPEIRLSEPTHSAIFTETDSRVQKRRLTLHQARQMALRAHYRFEEGLRKDWIQEARLAPVEIEQDT